MDNQIKKNDLDNRRKSKIFEVCNKIYTTQQKVSISKF